MLFLAPHNCSLNTFPVCDNCTMLYPQNCLFSLFLKVTVIPAPHIAAKSTFAPRYAMVRAEDSKIPNFL